MRRPPLVTFLTYERLGNTAIGLSSLLRTDSDFELFIMDNNSKDDTWEFLQDTKDIRIVNMKKFDQNMGVAHALNYALSHRQEDQDFINFEADFRIHNMDFVKDFQDTYAEFPELKAFSATNFPKQLQDIDADIAKNPARLSERNGKRVYFDTIMGFCSYFPYETWNEFMYYDEVNCLLDMEVQARLEVMGSKNGKIEGYSTGYAMDIRTSHTTHGGNCDTCLAYHTYCEQGEQKCVKHYERIMSKITEELGFIELTELTKERMFGGKDLKCGSIHAEGSLKADEIEKSLHILELFKRFSDEKA